MSPIYQPGDTVFIADQLAWSGKAVAVEATFVRMQGTRAVVTHNDEMFDVDVERLFKTEHGALFAGYMEC